ncbi:MAG TPA: methylmalonyl-CoA mutase family protein [Saprospiraceae bacterium]|nr:methylmalonyl-CoA mutase family protein [Saprospiraceae bacterium]HMQ85208.1 methylmalonyl-CoA mutase family protein [Saprospiraceae bacterium]
MAQDQHLFSEFPPHTKAEWEAKVLQDLKGQSLDRLNWPIEDDLFLAPFYHPEDFKNALPALSANRDWEIGAYVDVQEVKAGNQTVLEALEGGVEAPLFQLNHQLSGEELTVLLATIEPTFISTHFAFNYADKMPWQFFELFTKWLEQQDKSLQDIKGSIDFDPLLDWVRPPVDHLVELIRFCQRSMPEFRVLQVNAQRFHHGSENISHELAFTLAKGNEYLAQLQEKGIDAATANQHLQFSLSTGKSYLLEIAKIRALKLLWRNILEAYGATGDAFVVTHLAKASQDENIYTNMIRAATQAMSAASGGANRVYVLPADHSIEVPSTAFTQRIARNVQHLLKMESYLHRVADPAAGSYYIEHLTRELATKAWNRFLELDEKRVFYAKPDK